MKLICARIEKGVVKFATKEEKDSVHETNLTIALNGKKRSKTKRSEPLSLFTFSPESIEVSLCFSELRSEISNLLKKDMEKVVGEFEK